MQKISPVVPYRWQKIQQKRLMFWDTLPVTLTGVTDVKAVISEQTNHVVPTPDRNTSATLTQRKRDMGGTLATQSQQFRFSSVVRLSSSRTAFSLNYYNYYQRHN